MLNNAWLNMFISFLNFKISGWFMDQIFTCVWVNFKNTHKEIKHKKGEDTSMTSLNSWWQH